MRASTKSDDTSRDGRRKTERRKARKVFEGPERRDAERRCGKDRRGAPRLPLD